MSNSAVSSFQLFLSQLHRYFSWEIVYSGSNYKYEELMKSRSSVMRTWKTSTSFFQFMRPYAIKVIMSRTRTNSSGGGCCAQTCKQWRSSRSYKLSWISSRGVQNRWVFYGTGTIRSTNLFSALLQTVSNTNSFLAGPVEMTKGEITFFLPAVPSLEPPFFAATFPNPGLYFYRISRRARFNRLHLKLRKALVISPMAFLTTSP